MSYSNFIIHGFGGNQHEHLRTQYPADVVVAGQGRAGFEGEEYWDEDETTKRSSIDSVVQVNTVCSQVREAERSFWKGHKDTSLVVFTVTLIGGVAAAVAAVAASAVFPPILGVVILTSIVSFNLLGFSFFNLYRHMQAKDQYKQWKDPLPKLIEQRQRVGVEGFGYAYTQQLKGKLVTQKETEDLWHAQMEETKMSFLGAVRGLHSVEAQKVRNFFETGHLSKEKVSYACSGAVPPNLDYLSGQYQALRNEYSELRTITDRCKRTISMQKNDRLRANDRQRDLQMAPWIQWFNVNYRQPLERERDVVVLQTRGRGAVLISGHSGRYRRPVENFDARFAHMEHVFDAMTAPIRALHAQNEHMINQWANSEMQVIQQNEDQQLTLFFNPICQLVSQYVRQEEVHIPAFPLNEEGPARPYPDLTAEVQPSAPPLEQEYSPPAYNPEWNSVVGKVDWETECLK